MTLFVNRPVHASNAIAASFESLEGRRLLASNFGTGASSTTLYIEATTANDTLSLRYRGPMLQVRLNGVLEAYAAKSVARIEVQGLDGHDIVDLSGIAIPTYVNAGLGNDLVLGGAGNDSLTGAAGKDTLRGGPGNDRLSGGNTADQIFGEDGSDVLYGGFGDDYMEGNVGVDWLFGEDGADRMVGGANNDRIYGAAGNDRAVGEHGSDLINGDGGKDLLWGGIGNDVVAGGAGVDYLFGEAGDDALDSKGDSEIDNVTGGDGSDNATTDTNDVVSESETVNGVVVGTPPPPPPPPPDPDPIDPPPPPSGTNTVALSFNDEALWDSHFDQMVAQSKSLGVKAVRVWLNLNSFDERPNAYDNVAEADVVKTWVSSTNRPNVGGLAMKRAFDLKAAGFTVLMTVNQYGGEAPATTAEVTNLFKHLVNSPRTPGSSNTLKNAVDYWEVGNEVDLGAYWAPSAVNKATGLAAYVDQFLLPAADVLRGTNTGEQVVSSSVSWNYNDLTTILSTLQARNRLDAIDYAGYHPYGRYDPTNPAIPNEILERTVKATKIGKSFGKNLIATEWNVRGFPNDGSRNAAWAQAIDEIYKTVIKPYYEIGFYYALVNNYGARGGNTTARPAGLFKHNSNTQVTSSTPIDELVTYFNTPLVASDPFHSMFNGW